MFLIKTMNNKIYANKLVFNTVVFRLFQIFVVESLNCINTDFIFSESIPI